ncbi:MAG: TerB family tellurite resistance protein, partial [Anaerolineales bacterium]|nr:TerB family tellurite resistance protein [Anaerolineales bacterium]
CTMHEPIPLKDLYQACQSEGAADGDDGELRVGYVGDALNLSRLEMLHAFKLAVVVALADSDLSKIEIDFMSQLAYGLGIPVDYAIELLDVLRGDLEQYESVLQDSAGFLRTSLLAEQRRQVYALLTKLANIDKRLAVEEKHLLKDIKSAWKI